MKGLVITMKETADCSNDFMNNNSKYWSASVERSVMSTEVCFKLDRYREMKVVLASRGDNVGDKRVECQIGTSINRRLISKPITSNDN